MVLVLLCIYDDVLNTSTSIFTNFCASAVYKAIMAFYFRIDFASNRVEGEGGELNKSSTFFSSFHSFLLTKPNK